MERRLWSNIASLLGRAKQRPAAIAGSGEGACELSDRAVPADRHTAGPGGPETRLKFGQRLNAATQYGEAIAAGRIKLINFGRIKGDYGLKWPEVADRVGAAIQAILRKRLGPRDSFLRLDDTHFALMLSTRDETQAQLICSLIAAEIKQKLFGIDRDFSAVQLATATVRVGGGLALDPVDPVGTLTALLDQAPQVTDHEAVASGGLAAKSPAAPGFAALGGRGVQAPAQAQRVAAPPPAMLTEIRPNALEALLKTMSRQIGDWRQFAGPAEQVIYDGASTQRQIAEGARRQQAVRLLESAASGAAAPMLAQGQSERDFIMSQVKSATFRYQPIWHRGTQAITSYGLTMRFLVGDAHLSLGELMEWEDDPQVIVSVDLMIVKKGLADLAAMLRQGTKAILSLPLHRAVLDLPLARAQLLSTMSDVPPQIRKLVLFEILDSYAGDWTVLPALVVVLKRVSRDVVLRVSLDQTDFSRVRAAGVHVVGGDLRDHPWPQTRSVRALSAFGKAARVAGYQSYVFGLNAPPLAVAAVAAGIDYLAGSAVAQETPEPLGVLPLDTASISPEQAAEG